MRGKRGTWGGKVKDHDYAGYSEGSGGGRGDYYRITRCEKHVYVRDLG